MSPSNFPESNVIFRPPEGIHESQCGSIPARIIEIQSGPWDGTKQVIVGWKPDAEDLKRLNAGGLVYLATVGNLMPHFLCTDIQWSL